MNDYETKKVVGRRVLSCSSSFKNGQNFLLIDLEDDGGRRVRLSVASDSPMTPKVRALSEFRESRGAWRGGAKKSAP